MNFVSGRAEALLGYPIANWRQQERFWGEVIHPQDRERALAFFRQATRERRNHKFEYRVHASDDGRTVGLRDIVHVTSADPTASPGCEA